MTKILKLKPILDKIEQKHENFGIKETIFWISYFMTVCAIVLECFMCNMMIISLIMGPELLNMSF